jgi:hypothetical protein
MRAFGSPLDLETEGDVLLDRHPGKSAYSWNTMPRSGPGPATGTPSTVIVPLLGCEKPATALSRVDLPQPEGPSRQVNWPAGCRAGCPAAPPPGAGR